MPSLITRADSRPMNREDQRNAYLLGLLLAQSNFVTDCLMKGPDYARHLQRFLDDTQHLILSSSDPSRLQADVLHLARRVGLEFHDLPATIPGGVN